MSVWLELAGRDEVIVWLHSYLEDDQHFLWFVHLFCRRWGTVIKKKWHHTHTEFELDELHYYIPASEAATRAEALLLKSDLSEIEHTDLSELLKAYEGRRNDFSETDVSNTEENSGAD